MQFRAETDAAQGRYAGRVEHVASGQVARFASQEELWAFLTRMLREVQRTLAEDV